MNSFLVALHSSNLLSYKELKNLEEMYGDYEKAWIELRKSCDSLNNSSYEKVRNFIKNNHPEHIITKLNEQGIFIITINDSIYPQLLRESKNPPLVIYTQGDQSLLNNNMLAIVGTRFPTPYAKKIAYEFSCELSQYLTIVSGLAVGIDTEAHKGALNGEKKTIAVLGSGFDHPYPPQNKNLLKDIITQGGLVLSEYPPQVKPDSWRFPQRNRIIASLSLGTLVVEAGSKSGALITSKISLDEGREVFAVPGLITNIKASGSNDLIKDGAHLVTSFVDVLEALSFIPKTMVRLNNNEFEKNPILKLVSGGPLTVENIVETLKMSVEEILYNLTILELQGKIKRENGYIHRI